MIIGNRSKRTKAEKLGVEILDEDGFRELMQNETPTQLPDQEAPE